MVAIDGLNPKDLEDYVYNVYQLNNEDLIGNSFVKYLSSLNNFKRFERFVRFIGDKHSAKLQENVLLEVCSKKYSPFDWIFSAKKVVHKSAFNKLIKKYIEYYKESPINIEYLNNFLKLKKN